ncbi:MAG: amino acid permease [Planctomycetes bacterium]|nr:amino acid permease [Planctomycetota bacterium]
MATTVAGERPGGASIRQLGLFTVLCIGVNNIVGSGIYRKPSELARHLGGASWIAFAIDGLLLLGVALSFAAMSARHDEAGGPYLYARRAFGRVTGFVVAWTAWISMWAALAAAATGIPGYLDVFVPGARDEPFATLIAVAIVVALAILNCRGVRSAAGTATFLTVAKLLPLLIFVIAGLFAIDAARLAWWPVASGPAAPPAAAGAHAATAFATASPLGLAIFAAFYPLQGFEVVPVPAGELKNARRDVPLAVTLALVLSAAFYCLIQIVAVGACPQIASDPALATRPLAAAAATFMGKSGERLMSIGACVSMLGFAAVTMFCAPRFLLALGRDGLLPAAIGRLHPKRGTPTVAILVTAAAALLGTLFPVAAALWNRLFPAATPLDGAAAFEQLTALSNLAVLVQYAATCLAVITLRAHVPGADGGFRLPGGRWPIPLAGLAASALLAFLITQDATWQAQVATFAAWVAGGLALSFTASRRARAAAR